MNDITQLQAAVSVLITAITVLATSVLGFVAARKLFRKLDADSPRDAASIAEQRRWFAEQDAIHGYSEGYGNKGSGLHRGRRR